MANVDIIIRTIDQTGVGVSSSAANMKKMAAQLAVVTAAAVAVGAAMKKAFDLGREGAMLEFTAAKFDRLSKSIGTTADALLNDLRKATSGIYSDMELMASATDMVGLGLAKTHDEAVRLAKVAGGLDMNMNQLVLTLTNMTTMRFDALNVRVDGFKERLKGLEKQGYSTNDAFKEAFLQQAEEQLRTVGNAADETIGTFKRFEASWKNSMDGVKRTTAVSIEPIVGFLNQQIGASNKVRDALLELNPELYGQYRITYLLTPEMQKLVSEYGRMQSGGKGFEVVLNDVTSAMENNYEAVKTLYDERVASTIDAQAAATDNYNDKVSQLNKSFEDGKISAEEHAAGIAAATASYEESANKITLGLVQMALAADGWQASDTAAYLSAGVSLGQFTNDQALAAEKTIGNAQAIADAHTEMYDVASGNEVALTALGQLDQQLFDGKITASDYKDQVSDLINTIENLDGMTAYADVFVNIITSGGIPSSLTTLLPNAGASGGGLISPLPYGGASSVKTANTLVSAGRLGGRASGGPVNDGQSYLIGEQGPEILTMRGNGNISPNNKLGAFGGISDADMRKIAKMFAAELSRFIG